jgi:DNA-binding transcriptional MerR regulator
MFTTGQFSRIARVSKRLLQFYDEEGIFHPAKTDPRTGYRGYQAHQLPELNRILALKEIGLSLDEIRAVLRRGISEEEVRHLLHQKQAELQIEVQSSLRRLRAIEARLAGEPLSADIVLKSFGPAVYYSRKALLPSTAQAWDWVRETAAALLSALSRQAIECVSVTLPGDGFETSDFILEAGVILTPGAMPPQLSGFARSEIPTRPLVATVVQRGGPELMHQGCGALGRHLESQALTLLGAPREAIVEFPLPADCTQALIESQFDVAPI